MFLGTSGLRHVHRLCVCHGRSVSIIWSSRRSISSTSILNGDKYQNARKPSGKYIKHEHVNMVDPETGSLKWVKLSDVLASLDEEKYTVQLVTEQPDPIIKVIDKMERRERLEKQKETKRLARRAQTPKEIQLTWAMSEQDLSHKIQRIRDVLLGGGSVDVVISSKARPQPIDVREKKRIMDDMLEQLCDAGSERKDKQLRGDVGVIFLQGAVRSGENQQTSYAESEGN